MRQAVSHPWQNNGQAQALYQVPWVGTYPSSSGEQCCHNLLVLWDRPVGSVQWDLVLAYITR